MIWGRETFAVAKSRDSAKYDAIPGYEVSPETERQILDCLTNVLLIDQHRVKVLPVSDYDRAKVGKRFSAHPIHETYFGKDIREKRQELYNKAEPETLVAELDVAGDSDGKKRQLALSDELPEPVERVQRVFTTPLEDLVRTWTVAAVHFREMPRKHERR